MPFKRKVYGKVKPVRKHKEKPPAKPAVNGLKAIFSRIKRSPEYQLPDLLSEALVWWLKAIPYIQFKYKEKIPLEAAKAFAQAQSLKATAQDTDNNKLKIDYFVDTLRAYKRYSASAGVKVPDLISYLKKSKELTKKTKVRNKKLTKKFDNILTLIAKCFNVEESSFEVCDVLKDSSGKFIERKWDHTLGKIFYTRTQILQMKKTLFHQGLLALVLEEADFIARGSSLLPGIGKGSFIPSAEAHLSNYRELLDRFETFSHHRDCPKTISKREKVPKKGKE